MSSRPSSSKPQGVTKCRYTTSALSKRARQGSTRGTMADNKNTTTQAEEDRLLMPPPPRPTPPRRNPKRASPKKINGTNTSTMTLRPRKNKNKDKPEPIDTATATTTKKPEDDLPPIEPLTWEERLLFPVYTGPRLFETMTPGEVEVWRELEPQAGDRLLTVDEVDKLCDDFYKESRG